MRVLGVDPGSRATGWGLIGGTPAAPRLLDAGVIRLSERGFPERLGKLQTVFAGLVERLQPEGAAVEAPFHGASARSALQLAHARGVILAVLARSGVPVAEYAPATVKQAVTGNGAAEKAQVAAMIARLLPSAAHAPGDLADALAVALCHATSRTLAAAVRRGLEPRRPA